MSSTILTHMAVAGQDVPAVEMKFLFRELIVFQQADDARHQNLEVYRTNPILIRLFHIRAKTAEFSPGIKGIVGKFPVFLVDNFR